MNKNLMPVLCGTALAIMTGATATHFFAVRQMVGLAQLGGGVSAPAVGDATTLELMAEFQREKDALQATVNASRALQAGHASAPAPEASSPDLNRALTEIVSLIREQRTQLAETNRDLMELQFRVDSHSEQFRPLNVTDPGFDDPYGFPADEPAEDIGVLPPIDLP